MYAKNAKEGEKAEDKRAAHVARTVQSCRAAFAEHLGAYLVAGRCNEALHTGKIEPVGFVRPKDLHGGAIDRVGKVGSYLNKQ